MPYFNYEQLQLAINNALSFLLHLYSVKIMQQMKYQVLLSLKLKCIQLISYFKDSSNFVKRTTQFRFSGIT